MTLSEAAGVLAALTNSVGPLVLLEDRLSAASPARLYCKPANVVRCGRPEELEEAFHQIETGIASGLHAAGFFAYELGYALEPRLAGLMPRERTTPLLWFGLFEPPYLVPQAVLDIVFGGLAPPPPITELSTGHRRVDHVAKVVRALEMIAAGDIYQVNLTFPMCFRYAGSPLSLYAALRSSQPVAHGAFLRLDGISVLSASPELFVRTTGAVATTRPMKGTAARGPDQAADEHAKRLFAGDPKQRAENLMITDLLRNDLARISVAGTVRTPALFSVETYPSFHALTSTVTAELRAGVRLRERIGALFPCGSIVGAPKIRASEIIAEIEAAPRGIYTGSIGAIAPDGDMAFNVAIRTAVLDADGVGTYGVGGGIVADSVGDAEYDEALLKARVLTELAADYCLIETFRWSRSSGFVRLDHHLARLGASAGALGFAFSIGELSGRLLEIERGFAMARTDMRMRVALSRAGRIEVTCEPLNIEVRAPLRLCVTDVWLDAGDPFVRHKTSRRLAYEQARAVARQAGCDEGLLLNRSGMVADASRHTVFAEIEGRLVTPPASAGALPGILRGCMIASGEVEERALSVADLAASPRILLGSSLQGLRRADFAGAAAQNPGQGSGAVMPP